jgi:hypothetical protein
VDEEFPNTLIAKLWHYTTPLCKFAQCATCFPNVPDKNGAISWRIGGNEVGNSFQIRGSSV